MDENTAAVIIQSTWRAHHCRLMTVASLLQMCQLDCDFRGSGDYKENVRLQIRMQSFAKAMACAGDRSLTAVQIDGRKIKIDWSKEVVIRVSNEGDAKMETAKVTLKCSMIRPLFSLKWSSRRLVTVVVKAALLEAFNIVSEELVSAYASVIQSWVRMILEKKRGSSSRRGGIPPIRTSGLEYLAQYLTPTSLQHRSAITLQNAWRFHQAQVRAADVMLTDWRVACDLRSDVSDNRILAMKVGLNAIEKAVGRVDCLWITEGVIIGGHVVSVKWNRDIGVHFTVKGVPKLESYTVHVDCKAFRTAFVEQWGRRKLAILVIKAALNRAIGCDRSHLVDTSATLIQTWFRMIKPRSLFLRQVSACKRIQKYVRRLHSRVQSGGLELLLRHDVAKANILGNESSSEEYAVTVIQSFVRRYLLTHLTQRRKAASSKIQYFVRRQRPSPTIQSRNAAAAVIQCTLLQLSQRRIANRKLHSAVTIQSYWRSASTRDAYAELRRAATVIQTWERRRQCVSFYLAMLETRKTNTETVAASIIQRVHRGVRAHNQASVERRCATKIQSAYRRYEARSNFRTIIIGVTALQAAYRGIMSRHLISLWHVLVVRSRSALLVQSLWRGSQVRRRFGSLRASAIVVQSAYRRHYAMCDFQMVRLGMLALQARHRGASCRSRMHLQWAASVTLQRFLRGSRGRANEALLRGVALSEEAATKIQSWYRCWELRRDYLALRQAAIDIQKFERRRKCFVMHQRLLDQMISFQALCRGAATRNMVLVTAASAKLIQTTWRRSRLQKYFMTCRKSAVMLQCAVRRILALRFFQKVLVGVTSMQAHYRGRVVRSRLLRQSSAAVTVQAQWRKRRAGCVLCMLREDRSRTQSTIANGVVFLQRGFRHRQQQRVMASILLQRCYRRYVASRRFLDVKQSVVQIQASERRRQALSKHTRFLDVIVRLQTRQRETQARQLLQAMRSQTAERAAVIIQGCWRRYYFRQNFMMLKHFATQIQSVERCRQTLMNYQRFCRGIIRLQAHSRGALSRQMLIRLAEAAVIIQRYQRGFVLRQHFLALKHFTTKIQTAVRRRLDLSMYYRVVRGTVRLQACRRGIIARQGLSRESQTFHAAATLIQSCWKSYYRQKIFLSMRRAAIKIQTSERRRRCLLNFTRLLCGIVHLQAFYRGFETRKALKRRIESKEMAVLLIQSCWRRYCYQRRFLAMSRMAVRLQAQYRGVLLRQLLTELAAAVILQSICRRLAPRRHFLACKKAALCIQAAARRWLCRSKYARVTNGVILLQAQCRGVMIRQQVHSLRQAASRVQSNWRASLEYRRYRLFRKGVVAMQLAFRRHRAQRQIYAVRTGMTSLQALQRGILYRRVCEKQRRSATAIQTAWVQYRLRSYTKVVSFADPSTSPAEPSVSACANHDSLGSSRRPSLKGIHDLAAVAIQAHVRSFLAVRSLREMDASARLIQVKFFTWKMQLTLLMVQSSVVLLQRSVRGQLLRSAARFALSHINASLRSPVITSFRRITKNIDPGVAFIWLTWNASVDKAREAASIVIQSALRRWIAKRYCGKLRSDQPMVRFRHIVSRNAASAYMSIKSISSSVSSKGQPYAQRPTVHQQERQFSAVATVEDSSDGLPSHARPKPLLQPDRTDSAIVIQRAFRECCAFNEVRRRDLAACRIQKEYRRRLETMKYARFRGGLVSLQSQFRGARVRSTFASLTGAAICIQKAWRMQRERQHYNTILTLVFLLQTRHRMRFASKSFQRQKEAALLIQNRVRAWQSFCARKKAARVIQSRFRAWQQGASVRSDMELQFLACIRLQRTWRLYRDCRRYYAIRKMALLLQATRRMQCQSRSYRDQKEATLILQTFFRGYNQRAAYSNLIADVVKLQALGRQFLTRMAFQKATCAAVVVQRVWRGVAIRRKLASIPDDFYSEVRLALDEGSPATANESISTLDREKVTERIQESLVSHTDSKSKSEVNELLSGDTACLVNAGPCIQRLVHRVTDAQNKAAAVAFNLEKRSFVGDTTAMERRPDFKAVTTLQTSAQLPSVNETPRPNEQDAELTSVEQQTPSPNTLDLAMEAQNLLLEARRARVKFQNARTRVPANMSMQQTAKSSPSNQPMSTDATQSKTHIFGDIAKEDELPSPIKPEEEEWDWANNWK